MIRTLSPKMLSNLGQFRVYISREYLYTGPRRMYPMDEYSVEYSQVYTHVFNYVVHLVFATRP